MDLKHLILQIVPSRGQLPLDSRDIRLQVLKRVSDLSHEESITVRDTPLLIDQAVHELAGEGQIIKTSESDLDPVDDTLVRAPRGIAHRERPRIFHGYIRARY